MRRSQFMRNEQGFTLIEMIGVIAVIAILASMVAPKIFSTIQDARINALMSAAKTYESAVTKYYADLGTVQPLNAAGTPAIDATGNSATVTSLPARLILAKQDPLVGTTNLWPKFNGPYLEKFNTLSPPFGTQIFMPSAVSVAYGTATTAANVGFDLKGTTGNSTIPTNSTVDYIQLTGISQDDFDKLDRALEPEIGTTAITKQLWGRAKWGAAGGGTALIYLAHQ